MLSASLCHLLPEALQETVHVRRMLILAGCGYISTLAIDQATQTACAYVAMPDTLHHALGHASVLTGSDADASCDTTPLHHCIHVEQAPGQHRTAQASAGALPLVFAAALSFHSVVEGAAVGSQRSTSSATAILVAVLFHKLFAALALGVNLTHTKVRLKLCTRSSWHMLSALYLHRCLTLRLTSDNVLETQVSISKYWAVSSVFAVASPIGVILGRMASDFTGSDVTAMLTAVASGTFLYIAATELIPRELPGSQCKAFHTSCVIAGFMLMSAIALWI